jgi:hypothetical protein
LVEVDPPFSPVRPPVVPLLFPPCDAVVPPDPPSASEPLSELLPQEQANQMEAKSKVRDDMRSLRAQDT